ncbi:acyltransferase family protein [Kushneria sp. Sum13]|uniref:acyltransferase family protein n=1 Tax=Kushneria sp. Sum13 TaxID=3459196 RepID=UPI004045E0AE
MMNKNFLWSLHYLRGIASITVVLYHLKSWLPNDSVLFSMLRYCSFGVDLFFILSGFVIVHATRKDRGKASFAIKRIFRIWPPFVFACLAYFFLVDSSSGLKSLIKSLILIHLNYNVSAPEFGYNLLVVAWTLTYEVAFYSIFLTALAINHKWRVFICSSFIIISVFSLQIFSNGHVGFHGDDGPNYFAANSFEGIVKVFGNSMLLEFLAGMLIASIYYRIPDSIFLRARNVAPVSLFLCLIFFFPFLVNGYYRGLGIDAYGAWSILFIILLIIIERSRGVIESNVLIFLGNISYSLYLCHIVVNDLIKKISPPFLDHISSQYANSLVNFSFSVSLSIFIAYMMFVFIERPSIKAARVLIKKMGF